MTQPTRYLTRIAIFLVLVAAILASLSTTLRGAFLANPALNGAIALALLGGIVYTLREVLRLRPEIDWIVAFQAADDVDDLPGAPRLLAPMATMLGDDGDRSRLRMSSVAMRSLLDGIGARLEEGRETSRYLVGLLVFLGLLGTFWGLLGTISAIGQTINSLSGSTADPASLFDDLKAGLQAPLRGMGTAFSSSLFGLAGSLVLGFLDLQLGQAQNRFYNELEDWLATFAKAGGAPAELATAAGGAMPAYLSAVMEQSADSLDVLARSQAKADRDRRDIAQALGALSEQMATLSDRLEGEQSSLEDLARGQNKLIDAVKAGSAGASDASTTPATLDQSAVINQLRTLDGSIKRLMDAQTDAQDQMLEGLSIEFRKLARTIAAIIDENRFEDRS